MKASVEQDDLKAKEGVRDIVDTRKYEPPLDANFLLHALLGSVNKRARSLPASPIRTLMLIFLRTRTHRHRRPSFLTQCQPRTTLDTRRGHKNGRTRGE